MTLDVRTLRIVSLAAVANLFVWLWASGESVRYLGPRTQWVVPVGAIGLCVAAVGYMNATRERPPVRVTLREAVGLSGLLVPVLAAVLLAHAQLGSLAASNKLSSRGVDPSALAGLDSGSTSKTGFLQLNVAGRHPDQARELGIAAGKPARLVGFVSSTSPAHRSFELSRFYITCCVADAVPVGVPVAWDSAARGPAPRRNDWLDVTGVLAKRGQEFVLRSTRIERIDPPSDPYLSFTG